MELTNGENKLIVEMYKGKERVWELPTVMTSMIELKPGDQSIRLTTYPSGCQVTITVNDVVYEKNSGPSGSVVFTLNEALKNEDSVDVLIEKDGWKSLDKFFMIY